MTVQYVTLGDVCKKGSSGIAQKDLENRNGEYPIYGASGLIKYVDFYQQEQEYIAVVKDGAGIGRTMRLPGKSSVIGTMQYIIPDKKVNISYLYYAITFMNLSKYFSGATIPHIYFKDYQKERLPLPSMDQQRKIAYVLETIDTLILYRKRQLLKLDELVQSRFIEMFGDPAQNPFGWSTSPLLEMGYCKNGMNFHTGDRGIEMHCLGVGDFKDYSVIDGTKHLPTISLNEAPPEESMLQDGDIVFVRSNGNKALVGRCLVVYPHNTPTTYSGFCIRYRLMSDAVNTSYLLRVLKTDTMRKKMAGRGANIQNLNQQILATLDIPTPPLGLQEQFADFVAQVDKSKYSSEPSHEIIVHKWRWRYIIREKYRSRQMLCL